MARQGENVSAPVGAQARPVRGPIDLLREARLRRRSPAGSGRRPSRQDLADLVIERLTMFKRSGAAMTVTYSAKDAARILAEQPTPPRAVPLPRDGGTAP